MARANPKIKLIIYLNKSTRRDQDEYREVIKNNQLIDVIASQQALFQHIGIMNLLSEEVRIFTKNKHFIQPGYFEYLQDYHTPRDYIIVSPLSKLFSSLKKKVNEFSKKKEEVNPEKFSDIYKKLDELSSKIDDNNNSESSLKAGKDFEKNKSVLESTEASTQLEEEGEEVSDNNTESKLTFSSSATLLSQSCARTSFDTNEYSSSLDTVDERKEFSFIKNDDFEEEKEDEAASKYDFESKFYKESTNQFKCKMYSHFKSKPNQESVGFINSLDNLVSQHIIKISKRAESPIGEEEAQKYFLHLRDKLHQERYVTGVLYEFWVKHRINTLHLMNNSTKLKVDVKKLEHQYRRYRPDKEGKEESSKTGKIFQPIADVGLYAGICYTIIKTMGDKHFYHDEGSSTNYKKYMKVIENLIKNLYNSKALGHSQKSLLKKDKTVRYLLMKLLENYGVYKVKNGKKLGFSEIAIDQFCDNLRKYSKDDLLRMIISDIQNLKGKQLN